MSFDNPITQGTKLVIDAIRSPNYAVGSTGWTINKDGSAEFNNMTVRGEVHITGTPPAEIIMDTIGGAPYVDFVDLGNRKFTLQQTSPASADMAFNMGSATANVPDITVIQNQGIKIRSLGSGTRGVLIGGTNGTIGTVNGFLYHLNSSNAPELWNSLTLPATWGQDQPCQYKLFPDGVVRCRGIINATPNPIPGGTVIFTLPAGYRPPQTCYFDAVFDASATRGRFLVRTNGNVELYEAPNDLPDLGSIQFDVQS